MLFTSSPETKAQLFHHIFEESSLGIAVEDLNGKLLHANPALCSMLGYREEELCAMNCAEFDSEEERALLQKLHAGQIDNYSLEKCYVRKDGAPICGHLNVCLVRNGDGEAPFVLAFVEDVSKSKLAEDALRNSEQRYRLLFERTIAGVAIASPDGKLLDCNNAFSLILGYSSADEVRGCRTEDLYYNRSDREPLLEQLRQRHAVAGEIQLRRKDGTPVWVLSNITLITDIEGSSTILSTMIDITKRKKAEEALSGMTRKLVDAHEKERARIGRELHDDVTQRLAMLALELEQLEDHPSDIRSRLQELRKQTIEISNDVQALSHELHSSKVEYLGAIGGMKSWCKEFGERQGIQIVFMNPESKISPPPEVGLCLFRVLQEALHNAAKHSGVRRIEVQLWEDSGELHLVVSDLGRGFDWETAMQGRGLGLTSMQERVRLVNGTIEIRSKPMGGTTVHVRVPFGSEKFSERAAG